jgi:hypothetical protein
VRDVAARLMRPSSLRFVAMFCSSSVGRACRRHGFNRLASPAGIDMMTVEVALALVDSVVVELGVIELRAVRGIVSFWRRWWGLRV